MPNASAVVLLPALGAPAGFWWCGGSCMPCWAGVSEGVALVSGRCLPLVRASAGVSHSMWGCSCPGRRLMPHACSLAWDSRAERCLIWHARAGPQGDWGHRHGRREGRGGAVRAVEEPRARAHQARTAGLLTHHSLFIVFIIITITHKFTVLSYSPISSLWVWSVMSSGQHFQMLPGAETGATARSTSARRARRRSARRSRP